MASNILSGQELEIIRLLAVAWRNYTQLPVYHPADAAEFRHAIHMAQNIVLARPATKEMYLKDEPMDKVA